MDRAREMAMKTLAGFLYGSTPAEFKSAFGLKDSVEHLRLATRRSAFGVLAQQAAAGPVSETRVRLQRVIPMVGNSFKPFFFGRFEHRGDEVHLVGRFSMLGIVKVFMTFWLGAVLAFGMVAGLALPAAAAWKGFLVSLAMFAAGLGLIGLGKWFARNDIAWLSDVIGVALGGAPKSAAVSAQSSPSLAAPLPDSTAPPTVLRVTALVLFLSGVSCVWGAASGVSSWHVNFAGHAAVTHFSSSTSRLPIGACGLVMCVLGIGVYRSRPWAWSGLLVFIVASGVMAIPRVFLDPYFPDISGFRAICGVLMLAVTAYWAWWWYAQRVHFKSVVDVVPLR
jgi:hypothetical protein